MTSPHVGIERLATGDECVLLHDSLPLRRETGSSVERGSILFSEPVRTITCREASELEPAFEAIERALEDGHYVAGAFAYELGYWLEERLKTLAPETGAPLFQVGVFEAMARLSSDEVESRIPRFGSPSIPAGPGESGLQVHLSRTAYRDVVSRLHEYILAGDVYQANFTFPITFRWPGDVWQIYRAMSQFQRVAYGGVVDLPDVAAASLSPELFFEKRGRIVTCRPMKGTIGRGHTAHEDQRQINALRTDPKNRAENLIIVDLIRNDLGRLARIGGVRVDGMFEVETYSTLHQMVSTVRAELADEPSVLDIFRRLFPCGSVTGAPKIRAMEIIAELEDSPRGIYTGAIGYVTPDRDMCFSVPIRTVTLQEDGTAKLGVGSGVVADSVIEDEYDECRLKARFLKNALMAVADRPGLIETMRAVDGVIPLLSDHRARLRNSAATLGIGFSSDDLWREVIARVRETTGEKRVRLQLDADGSWEIEMSPVQPAFEPLPGVILSSVRLQSSDPLLAHKTTRRRVHDRARLAMEDVDNGFDVLLFNERGELCEGGITNVFLELDGKLVTPALECGLLAGIGRARVIRERKAEERVLFEEDVLRAEKIFLTNAVRGFFEVVLLD